MYVHKLIDRYRLNWKSRSVWIKRKAIYEKPNQRRSLPWASKEPVVCPEIIFRKRLIFEFSIGVFNKINVTNIKNRIILGRIVPFRFCFTLITIEQIENNNKTEIITNESWGGEVGVILISIGKNRDKGIIKKIFPKVKVEDHNTEVMETLKA